MFLTNKNKTNRFKTHTKSTAQVDVWEEHPQKSQKSFKFMFFLEFVGRTCS